MRTQLISNSTPDGSAPQALKHKPVLLQEVLDALELNGAKTVFDGTLGSAGHAEAIFRRLSRGSVYIACDLDPESIERAKARLYDFKSEAKLYFCNANFKDIDMCLAEAGLESIDRILLDLGWSQDQFENSKRGFSFRKDEPLKMSYNPESELDAETIVNEWSEETLADIIYGFGQERFARKIAKAIVDFRACQRITTSKELAEIIYSVYPKRFFNKKIDPATKTFQALRIAVNRELEVLEEALNNMHEFLSPGGRVVIISFHSLEDRIVKRKFLNWEKQGFGFRVNKKVIKPTEEELKNNPRARSAKLRVYEKASET